MFSIVEQERILQIALSSIQLHFENKKYTLTPHWMSDKELLEKRGTFVTLTENDELRGCIGSIMPIRPLWEDVSENAVHAAFHDPRFEPLKKHELPVISLEVSILTVPKRIMYTSFQELEKQIRPLIDGVIIQSGFSKATFLPQVWEELREPDSFFKHLCLKAGLPGNYFLTHFNDLIISTYQAEIIHQKK